MWPIFPQLKHFIADFDPEQTNWFIPALPQLQDVASAILLFVADDTVHLLRLTDIYCTSMNRMGI